MSKAHHVIIVEKNEDRRAEVYKVDAAQHANKSTCSIRCALGRPASAEGTKVVPHELEVRILAQVLAELPILAAVGVGVALVPSDGSQ